MQRKNARKNRGFPLQPRESVEECDRRLERGDGNSCQGAHMAVTRDRISIHDDLVRAINEKRVIEFVYKTAGRRLAEPDDYGMKKGVEWLLAYQLTGASRSKVPHGWRHIEVAHVRDFKVLERQFPGSRADAAQHHGVWDVIFARVK
jgi:hypothetical protein